MSCGAGLPPFVLHSNRFNVIPDMVSFGGTRHEAVRDRYVDEMVAHQINVCLQCLPANQNLPQCRPKNPSVQ
jgi:hypothetical protein